MPASRSTRRAFLRRGSALAATFLALAAAPPMRPAAQAARATDHVVLVSLDGFDPTTYMDPARFAFGLMTRSKAITYDNLRLRAPDFVAKVDRSFARQVRHVAVDAELGER